MSLPLVLHRYAKRDISEAMRWYERQQPGREKQFEAQLEKAFERIKERPKRLAPYFQDVRFHLLNQFSYVIYYRILADVILVIAVLHGSRDPDVWRLRR